VVALAKKSVNRRVPAPAINHKFNPASVTTPRPACRLADLCAIHQTKPNAGELQVQLWQCSFSSAALTVQL
jgi:hypothetical protein